MTLKNRARYDALSTQDKETLLKATLWHLTDFHFVRMQHFSAFGQESETGVFRYKDGREFVFVPGDTVTLGWNSSSSEMDEKTRQEMETALALSGPELDTFLNDTCTPVRTATVSPMLAEREVHEHIGWKAISLTDPRITENASLAGFLHDFMAEPPHPGTHKLNEQLKLQYVAGELRAEIYEEISFSNSLPICGKTVSPSPRKMSGNICAAAVPGRSGAGAIVLTTE
ncbi:hypothetical protein [Superficieibacter electus]|uniref:hypothetical protein n=1 Tax=Superficieibacter electus TaxID=2022662 RepID=UPI001FEA6EA2|nr:hypothetical protein [Superficieibacter electus]